MVMAGREKDIKIMDVLYSPLQNNGHCLMKLDLYEDDKRIL